MQIQENIPLAPLTTFKLGGPARYFTTVTSVDELKETILWAQQESLPFFILGGGSNILVSDKGYDGLVVKMDIRGRSFLDRKDHVEVIAAAGENWDSLVEETIDRGICGLENMSYVPGSVGAAPVQNIGCYGAQISDTLLRVEALNIENGNIKIFTNEECKFAYRDSFFKTTEGKKYIITAVHFALKQDGKINTSYKDVHLYFEQSQITKPTLGELREALRKIRSYKFPDLSKYGSAGSFFKMKMINEETFSEMEKKFKGIPKYKYPDGNIKLPFAWILDKVLHYNGVREEQVGAYDKQVIAIVHYGGATAEEVKKFSDRMVRDVEKISGEKMEPEVTFVGNFN